MEVNISDYDELMRISERERVLYRLYVKCIERNKICDNKDKMTGLPFETIALIMGWRYEQDG